MAIQIHQAFMYQHFRDIIAASDQIRFQLNRLIRERDLLIKSFDENLGGLRLSMRLRKRSGGLLAWRNVAIRGQDQRDLDLREYENDLVRLPQAIREHLLSFEKKRIIINLNISLLQHEKKQLNLAVKKIDLNTSHIESMYA